MKTIRNLLIMFFVLCFMSSSAWAVGTITGTATKIYNENGRYVALSVVLTCTADSAAASYPATTLVGAGISAATLDGLRLHYAQAYPGGTAPTDATDLTLTMNGVDILGGRGTDLIDATSFTSCAPGTIGNVGDIVVTGNITVNISNNAVNSAITTIILIFTND